VEGKLAYVLVGKLIPHKNGDPGSPIILVMIKGTSISNVLIDLGTIINAMTTGTAEALALTHMQPTSTVLQLVDLSITKPKGVLEDVIVTIDTWDYSVDFLILQTRKRQSGYPIILGRIMAGYYSSPH